MPDNVACKISGKSVVKTTKMRPGRGFVLLPIPKGKRLFDEATGGIRATREEKGTALDTFSEFDHGKKRIGGDFSKQSTVFSVKGRCTVPADSR